MMSGLVEIGRRGLACGLLLCVTLSAADQPASRMDELGPAELRERWKPAFLGIEVQSLAAERPRRMRGHAVRVDLWATGVEFLVTPDNGERPLECDSIKTTHFLEKHGLQVAINAAPFHPVVNKEGIPQEIVGLAISDGTKVSESDAQFAALLIDRENRARIERQPPLSLEGIRSACGGFGIVLEEGRVVAEADVPQPRSAIGITEDGRYLVLLVLDGRQPFHSQGATLTETGEWLRALGSYSGLNLDGGGSSCLAIEGIDRKAKRLNRPIHQQIPGFERPCPNHLGVRARPLAEQ
jgi:hypothetical protein